MEPITKSYIHKVKDLRIVSGTFKNDSGEIQEYKSIQLVLESDGQQEVLPLSGQSAVKPSALALALKGADNVTSASGYLED